MNNLEKKEFAKKVYNQLIDWEIYEYADKFYFDPYHCFEKEYNYLLLCFEQNFGAAGCVSIGVSIDEEDNISIVDRNSIGIEFTKENLLKELLICYKWQLGNTPSEDYIIVKHYRDKTNKEITNEKFKF